MTKTIITKTTILRMAAKAQAAKTQVVVILILALPLLITGGSTESIGAYKSKHISYSWSQIISAYLCIKTR